MYILFCHDPHHETMPDSAWLSEASAAQAAGCTLQLLDFEAIERNNWARAVRHIPFSAENGERLAIYRGWTLTLRQYEYLYEALLSRGVRLVTAPSAYAYGRHLPEVLDDLRELTPRTVYTQTDGRQVNYDMVMNLLAPFAGRAVILRDYVRVLKRDWASACYIASASDRALVTQVTQRFLEQIGNRLVGGLVYREFVHFKTLIELPAHKPPLTHEYRLVYAQGQRIACLRYWDVPEVSPQEPPLEPFAEFVARARSPFFMLDVAQHEDGTWMVIDVDDGQIGGLPEMTDKPSFYRHLNERFS